MKDKAKAAMAIDAIYALGSLLRDTGIQITILPAPRCLCAASPEADPDPEASSGFEDISISKYPDAPIRRFDMPDTKPSYEPSIDVGYNFGASRAGVDMSGTATAVNGKAQCATAFPVAKFINGDMVTLVTSLADAKERLAPVPAGILRCTAPVEEGQIIGVSTWLNNPVPSYLVRYRGGDGRQVETWHSEDALVLTSDIAG